VNSSYRSILLTIVLLFLVLRPVKAQEPVLVTTDDAWVDFPEEIDFHLVATAVSPVKSIVLEYGVDALTCGNIINRTEISAPGTELIDVAWRWDVLQGDIIPPGGQVWWRWHITLDDDTEFTTPEQRATFLDDWFVWQEIEADDLTLHWYRGSQTMAQRILDAAVAGKQTTVDEVGLALAEPIDIYLYDEPYDLQISVPGAPAWAGGVAFPEHNILLIAANEKYLEYGESTAKHEMNHMVVGRLTFNCVNSLPTWLSEGLAQVSEGDLDEIAQGTLDEAVANGAVLTLSQVSGAFSAHSDQATLSYAQSFSFVRFLLDVYGQEDMLTLLATFQAGESLSEAIMTAYDQDLLIIENEWRAHLGLEPLLANLEELIDATPSAVPTLGLMIVETGVTASPTQRPVTASLTPTPPATMTATPVNQRTAVSGMPTPLPTPIQAERAEPNKPLLLWGIGLVFVIGVVVSIIFLDSEKKIA